MQQESGLLVEELDKATNLCKRWAHHLCRVSGMVGIGVTFRGKSPP
jgi:hypothetical protein